MLLGQQRAGTILSLLPRDTILLILEWCDWGWFQGAGGEAVEGLLSDDDDEEEDVAPTMEEVLMLLPERKRASIGACFAFRRALLCTSQSEYFAKEFCGQTLRNSIVESCTCIL